MRGPASAGAGWLGSCSQDVSTWGWGSGAEHSPAPHSLEDLTRAGVLLAPWALDCYTRAADAPDWGGVGAANYPDGAASALALRSEAAEAPTGASAGDP